MMLKTKAAVWVGFALCLFSWRAHADKPSSADFLAAYRHIDLAASKRDIRGYMAYDAPGFVAGAGGHLSRSQAANIVAMQMKYALWFKSKTMVRQINVQGKTAEVGTQLHQEFLSAYLLPNGKREQFVLDFQNLDTWSKHNNTWQRMSSKTVAMRSKRTQR